MNSRLPFFVGFLMASACQSAGAPPPSPQIAVNHRGLGERIRLVPEASEVGEPEAPEAQNQKGRAQGALGNAYPQKPEPGASGRRVSFERADVPPEAEVNGVKTVPEPNLAPPNLALARDERTSNFEARERARLRSTK